MIISNCTNQEKYEINEILNQNDEQMNHNQTQTLSVDTWGSLLGVHNALAAPTRTLAAEAL